MATALDAPCVEWAKARNARGYGVTCVGHSKTALAHRVAWEQKFGPIPKGLCVLHRCDNPPCVNPDHLSLGTQADNVRDMFKKGRSREYKWAKGHRSYTAKLTAEQALEIRAASGPQRQIAARYGITQKTVSDIKARKRWINLEGENGLRP